MAEKIIPDLNFFAQEISNELQADFPTQRIKIAERLINFSPEKITDLHWQDWYSTYWKILNFLPYINEPPQNVENIAHQLMELAQRENNPMRRQYIALAFLLFGRVQEFDALANKNLWSENLREDFETFSKFNKLTEFSSNLKVRARLRRNQYLKSFLEKHFATLIKKYSSVVSVDEKTCPRVPLNDYTIWYCWFQGEKNLPPIVRCCYNSLKMNAGKYKIVFIDEKNLADYITLPEHIMKKFRGGV